MTGKHSGFRFEDIVLSAPFSLSASAELSASQSLGKKIFFDTKLSRTTGQ